MSAASAIPRNAIRDEATAGSALNHRIGGWALIALSLLLIVAPFAWIVGNSFKTQIAILSGAWVFTPTLDAYAYVLLSKRSDFLHGLMTSAILAVTSTAAVHAVRTHPAYSLYRLRWP